MYCNVDDLISATSERDLIELTDDEGSGSYNLPRIEKGITAATDKINGYCMARYSKSIPFTEVPGLINELCVEISIYNFYKRRQAVTDEIGNRYKDAVATLEKIARGIVKLMVDDVKVVEDGVTFTNKSSDDRVFKDPTGYIE
jgi:phage gp36-like protein